ncbi:MAG: GNAT family N-acetyltransferase [Clostridia bacterium]|nr:GNAT family N-acetyltransferase [Clostridia bacterium]
MGITKEELDRIVTKRLVLRKWRMEDAPSMFKYASDPAVGPICGWPTHKDIAESKQILNMLMQHPYCYAICLKKDIEHPIGNIELKIESDLTNKKDEGELGFWLGSIFWGKGYMPEAANALIKHAFNVLGYNAIWCGYFDGNNQSYRVQEKLGFLYQYTNNEYFVKPLKEVRVLHVSLLTKERWLSLNPRI